jgi:GNAT superfamily N-acetyltransferase
MSRVSDGILKVLRKSGNGLTPTQMAQDLATESWQRKLEEKKLTRQWSEKADGKKVLDVAKRKSLIGEGITREVSKKMFDEMGLKHKNINFDLFHKGLNTERLKPGPAGVPVADLKAAAKRAAANLSEKPDKYSDNSEDDVQEATTAVPETDKLVGRHQIGQSVVVVKHTDHPDHVHLDSIRTYDEHKGQGHAEHALKEVLRRADKHGKHVSLKAVPLDMRTKKDRLEHFYARHGFKKTHPNSTHMTRAPHAVQEETDIRTGKEVSHYNIYRVDDKGNKIHVSKAKTRKSATRVVDRRDNEYGAYVHRHEPVFTESVDLTEKIHPKEDWHKNKPEELLAHVYWLHNKLPPEGIRAQHAAYQSIVKQLHTKNPAPSKKVLDSHMNHFVNKSKKALVGEETMPTHTTLVEALSAAIKADMRAAKERRNAQFKDVMASARDEYLKAIAPKERKVSPARLLAKQDMKAKSESVELNDLLTELKKSTLANYIGKASRMATAHAKGEQHHHSNANWYAQGKDSESRHMEKNHDQEETKQRNLKNKRLRGISRAASKLANEEFSARIGDILEAKIIHHATEDGNSHSAKVYSKNADGEHLVKHFENGKHHEPSDYFSNDKSDALSTANLWVKKGRKHG